ncbi:hypothetical protein [Streptomyces sp. NBC_01304]|uniref:hypothetical protein n=1 Tax=Streptomyces sp. NBC_01304 TaxID=2903818 RepID=UPI002E1389E4|nr:hypothetical protein OG430_44915 [Streptomyces sp. NBC_01304]
MTEPAGIETTMDRALLERLAQCDTYANNKTAHILPSEHAPVDKLRRLAFTAYALEGHYVHIAVTAPDAVRLRDTLNEWLTRIGEAA